MYLQQKYVYQQTAQRKQNIAEAFSKKNTIKQISFYPWGLYFFKIV